MRLFDPHIHMTSRTTDDYQAMADSGIRAIIEPAFWLGQPRTHVGSFEDYFLSLVGWERFRASQFGIQHYCTMGLNPKEANSKSLAEGVMELLPLYMEKESVVAVGEIGYDDITPEEEDCFARQMEMAKEAKLPVVGFPEEQTLIDHNNEITLPLVLDTGCWAGHSIYPNTKMDEHRMVALVQQYGSDRMVINSAADWGVSDPLKVPKTAAAMREAGISVEQIEKICWHNPIEFFGQSGRIDVEQLNATPAVDQTQLFEGNSVLHGQSPRVK